MNSTNLRLRDKSPRSEDLEADDEQGDKTDNDHDRLSFHLQSTALSRFASIINRELHSELRSFPVLQPEPFGEQLSDDGQGTSTSGYHCFSSGKAFLYLLVTDLI